LKGKRVAWYLDFPVVNVNTAAYLAYAGLTWDDVERVDVEGFFDDALKALRDGDLDAAFAATPSEDADVAAAGPRGLFWPAIDPQNAEGLARMGAVAPYFVLQDVTEGAAVDPSKMQPGAHYPYPILVALQRTKHDLVYNMTKALVELYPLYQGKVLGIDGWNIDDQYFEWFVPYHDGAVTYFKELGVWTDEAQDHNDQLLARQEALAAAWEALRAENPENWESAWAERRRQALQDGGFQVIF
jgi:TRAP transporter TAXI family solute receptor